MKENVEPLKATPLPELMAGMLRAYDHRRALTAEAAKATANLQALVDHFALHYGESESRPGGICRVLAGGRLVTLNYLTDGDVRAYWITVDDRVAVVDSVMLGLPAPEKPLE